VYPQDKRGKSSFRLIEKREKPASGGWFQGKKAHLTRNPSTDSYRKKNRLKFPLKNWKKENKKI
jgi:hypothetical protein